MIKIIKSTNSNILILRFFGRGFFVKKAKNSNTIGRNIVYKKSKMLFNFRNFQIMAYSDFLYQKTIHEYLYSNKYLCDYNEVFKEYKKSLKNAIVIDEFKSKNNVFFNGRLKEISDILNDEKINYHFYFNGKEYNLRMIIEKTIKNISKPKKVLAFITQGDPTDTNIAINGEFTDFDNYGYNSIIGEISIFFASIFTHGNYFYPKYHSRAYKIRKNILSSFNSYKQKIEYSIDGDKIYIKSQMFKIPLKNKLLLKKYLSFFKKYENDNSFDYLKYYLCMRMLTPILIDSMDFDDFLVIVSYIIYIYENVNNYSSLVEMVDKLSLMEDV